MQAPSAHPLPVFPCSGKTCRGASVLSNLHSHRHLCCGGLSGSVGGLPDPGSHARALCSPRPWDPASAEPQGHRRKAASKRSGDFKDVFSMEHTVPPPRQPGQSLAQPAREYSGPIDTPLSLPLLLILC